MAMSNSVLHRAKPEILSIVEHLIEKMHVEMTELLVEVNYILLNVVLYQFLIFECFIVTLYKTFNTWQYSKYSNGVPFFFFFYFR